MWLPCVAMLLGWLAVIPTKTVRWVSALRLFSVSALWALVIGALSMNLAGSVNLAVRDPGPSIGIAAMVEETLKLAPLALIGVLAPGRIRRFAPVDWILLGLACGMGFQASEDFLRRWPATPATTSRRPWWRPASGWPSRWQRWDLTHRQAGPELDQTRRVGSHYEGGGRRSERTREIPPSGPDG